jgi:hypothetical protein
MTTRARLGGMAHPDGLQQVLAVIVMGTALVDCAAGSRTRLSVRRR